MAEDDFMVLNSSMIKRGINLYVDDEALFVPLIIKERGYIYLLLLKVIPNISIISAILLTPAVMLVGKFNYYRFRIQATFPFF